MKITITEALAEVKTIAKRIQKKREFIKAFTFRQEMVRDPLAKDGGSETAIAREMQAIGDLHQRQIAIRSAIQRVNLATSLSVNGATRSITDWLTWRKDVAPGEQKFLTELQVYIEGTRQQQRNKGINVSQPSDALKPQDIVVNLNEKHLAEGAETLETMLGTLDGKLSLLNATTMIDLD